MSPQKGDAMRFGFGGILVLVFGLLNVENVAAQEPSSKGAAPAAISRAICGQGTYDLSLGIQPFGRETFELQCAKYYHYEHCHW
jgi:hypothetical protein